MHPARDFVDKIKLYNCELNEESSRDMTKKKKKGLFLSDYFHPIFPPKIRRIANMYCYSARLRDISRSKKKEGAKRVKSFNDSLPSLLLPPVIVAMQKMSRKQR